MEDWRGHFVIFCVPPRWDDNQGTCLSSVINCSYRLFKVNVRRGKTRVKKAPSSSRKALGKIREIPPVGNHDDLNDDSKVWIPYKKDARKKSTKIALLSKLLRKTCLFYSPRLCSSGSVAVLIRKSTLKHTAWHHLGTKIEHIYPLTRTVWICATSTFLHIWLRHKLSLISISLLSTMDVLSWRSSK